jgi:hypothetical protein
MTEELAKLPSARKPVTAIAGLRLILPS